MMKKVLIIIIGLCTTLGGMAQQKWTVPETKVKYQGITLDEALTKAKETDKMVMIDFCDYQVGAYRMTVKHALLNDTVIDFINEHFVSLKVDISDKEKSRELTQKYDVTDWEFVFLDANGNVKNNFGGGWSVVTADYFLEWANMAWSRKDASPDEGMQFIKGNWEEVLNAAGKQNKLIFVDCYTKWCGPCTLMANMVFPLKQMGDYFNPRFVCTKLDMETEFGMEFGKKYQVEAYPTFLILDSTGREWGRMVGGAEANDFIQKTDSIWQRIREQQRSELTRKLDSLAARGHDVEVANLLTLHVARFCPDMDNQEKMAYVLQYFESPVYQENYLIIPLQLELATKGLNADTDAFLKRVDSLTTSDAVRKKVQQLREAYYFMREGAKAPFFELPDKEGKTVRLTYFQGKYVLIDIWGTWCKGCVESLPDFLNLGASGKYPDVIFLTIAIEQDKGERWHAFLKEKGETPGVVHLLGDKKFEKDYQISGVPRYIFINPTGEIIRSWMPLSEFIEIERLQEILDKEF